MTKTYLTILLALLTLPALAGRVWFPGRVAMTDGEVLEYPAIQLPDYTEPGLLVSESAVYHDTLTLYDANDIRYIEFWRPELPDSVQRLYSVLLRRTPRHIGHYWAVLDIQTPFGFVVMAYHDYGLTEDGRLEKHQRYGDRHFPYPRVFALHYGEAYYEQWPLRLDSPILQFLNRDVEAGSGETAEDFRMLFDTGFSPDDFFEPMSDMDFGW